MNTGTSGRRLPDAVRWLWLLTSPATGKIFALQGREPGCRLARRYCRSVVGIIALQLAAPGSWVLNDNGEPDYLDYGRDPDNGSSA